MATKLYIPYDVDAAGLSTFLIVRSPLRISALAASLIGKLLVKGLTSDESLVLLWLGERLKPLDTAKICYLLTLTWETKKAGGIIDLFSPEHWSHQNLDKRFPSLRGDLRRQAHRLSKQLKLNLKRVRRERPKPVELRRMGVGYRDHGTLSKYKFSWKDTPGNTQVIYHELFGRLSDIVIKTHITKALSDLKAHPQVAVSRSRRSPRTKPLEETVGIQTKPATRRYIPKTRIIKISEDLIVIETESLLHGIFKRIF